MFENQSHTLVKLEVVALKLLAISFPNRVILGVVRYTTRNTSKRKKKKDFTL
jgi:hypothetical protein